ncbi:hypothetical protein EVAR_51848_1 [Eumeta japonica]|uniref:Uncharacterized protein n=1 Tax=Eumeta variegata TaxID=151549 RepID=A0A4C1YSI4_EUMVA|nr:hypothetical protein EVAR_51848_1 [Eumeta japonica]
MQMEPEKMFLSEIPVWARVSAKFHRNPKQNLRSAEDGYGLTLCCDSPGVSCQPSAARAAAARARHPRPPPAPAPRSPTASIFMAARLTFTDLPLSDFTQNEKSYMTIFKYVPNGRAREELEKKRIFILNSVRLCTNCGRGVGGGGAGRGSNLAGPERGLR